MNFLQSLKMAWRSITGKKARSVLTILSIFIGIAAVMTIVSVMEGMKEHTRQQYAAMGSNRINVSVYTWGEDANTPPTDYFPMLYDYCAGMKDLVDGITPRGNCGATVVYGTKTTANMEYKYDDDWNLISAPPDRLYGSDQYAACNNLKIQKGRDISYLDVENIAQVCVLGAQTAPLFFGTADPIGQKLQVNGLNFEVIGVYAPRLSDASAQQSNMDNLILFPYTARRLLGDPFSSEFIVKAKNSAVLNEVISRLAGFLKGKVNTQTGGYNVWSENQWQESENQQMTMIGLVLGGIAAISLIVGGIGIMNIMLVTVTERTREIGIRRAVGAQKSTIVMQFLIEAAMLCGFGGIVGILVGTVGSIILSRSLFQITIYPQFGVTMLAFGLSVALGLLFGSYPAAKAAKLQPVDALRAE
ncbi:MAG: ABC transporter permease [Oscillospiraceae bacterium]|nr:ABC transporter permease [Oscillospiraceae bacterium]